MSADPGRTPEDTREFVALWNDTVEDHLVRQLAEFLPALARNLSPDDAAHATAMARPLVQALRLSAVSGDVAAAVRYLADAARGGESQPTAQPPR
jgi:hypothetical protein